FLFVFFFSSRRRHTRSKRDWSSDVCSSDLYKNIGPVMKVFPLVKEQKDQDELWRGIADGTISSVCSDHAPHTEEEKSGNIWSMPAGMCGVETIVPLMLNAVNEG